jgi:hypothetical protein
VDRKKDFSATEATPAGTFLSHTLPPHISRTLWLSLLFFISYEVKVMATSDLKGPGLLYVNSKIASSRLSSEVFTRWYEEEHIPDILRTSGMNSAYRYYTTSKKKASVGRPYLALYPLKDVSFLQTDEFKSIPVHSDLVPSESRSIFDVAEFDARYYINLGKEESQGAGKSK